MSNKHGSLSINSDNIFPIIKKWLYSDQDIFYRELVSNGCDAITKLKKLDMMGEYELPADYKPQLQIVVDPDGKKVTYGYDRGGQVISVKGEHWGHDFDYVTNILYDEYGQRTRIDYGNGTFTEYNYDPARRWLDAIKTENKCGQSYQNISYSFDAVGNVLGYENDCLDSVTGNYKTKQSYSYDNLYQLIKVDGETTYNPYQSSVPEFKSNYSQTFVFDDIGLGKMTSKDS